MLCFTVVFVAQNAAFSMRLANFWYAAATRSRSDGRSRTAISSADVMAAKKQVEPRKSCKLKMFAIFLNVALFVRIALHPVSRLANKILFCEKFKFLT